MFHVPEKFRVTKGNFASSFEKDGNNGVFRIERKGKDKPTINVICSEDVGWEHVSVTVASKRTPTWEEMALIKELFWDDDDIVVQIFPKKKDYINNHANCLHLFRKMGTNDYIEMPPRILVGVNDDATEYEKEIAISSMAFFKGLKSK